MNNISKRVVSLDSGRIVGYILDVAIDFSIMKKEGYVVVDEESEGEFLLRNSDVLEVSDEFVYIESASKLQFNMERISVFDKIVLDENANNFGFVQGVTFAGTRCEKIVTNKCEIPAKFVENVGQNVIFVRFGKKKRKKTAKNFEKTESSVIVSIQDVKNSRSVEIEKVMLSTDFYIGKTISQDVFGYNNEKIASSGQMITRSVVAKARQHNRMNQLFFAIKREK